MKIILNHRANRLDAFLKCPGIWFWDISAIFEPLSGVYTVTVLPCVNGGSISPFGIPAAQMSQTGIVALQSGSSQFFNIEPTTDGTVQDVKVDGVSVGAVTGYLFEKISDNHTISASFDDPV